MSLDPISQLSQYSTSIVSDALDELAVLGVLPGIEARRVGQGRVVGRALPVRLQPKSDDPSAYRFGGGVGKPLEQVLQTMQDGDIVVMDLGGSNRAAAWGGLASRIAQRRGVRGTIMWGVPRRGRDSCYRLSRVVSSRVPASQSQRIHVWRDQ